MRGCSLGHVIIAVEIGLHCFVEMLFGQIFEAVDMKLKRGVVDENMELTELVDSLSDRFKTMSCFGERVLCLEIERSRVGRMKEIFKLRPEDVGVSAVSSAKGPPPAPHSSRARQIRSERITLTHRPTGAEVSGEIAAGNYTRKQMIEERRRLKVELMAKLEKMVSSRLRLAGR